MFQVTCNVEKKLSVLKVLLTSIFTVKDGNHWLGLNVGQHDCDKHGNQGVG